MINAAHGLKPEVCFSTAFPWNKTELYGDPALLLVVSYGGRPNPPLGFRRFNRRGLG
jgi:hypothetical protein